MSQGFSPKKIHNDGSGQNNTQPQRYQSRGRDSGSSHGPSFQNSRDNHPQAFQPKLGDRGSSQSQSLSFQPGPKSGDRSSGQPQPASFQPQVTKVVDAKPGIETDIAGKRPNFDEGYEKSDYNNMHHPTPDRITTHPDRRPGGKSRGGGGGSRREPPAVREIIWKMRQD